jgi:pyruvate/2-oxoglutarate dehydrogenase complex dihydrolipoamide acyltransferase (E2) component
MRPFDRSAFPSNRRFVLAAMRSGRRMALMTGLVKVDVTAAWDKLEGNGLSPSAFFAACVGRAVADHPEVHAYRDWMGRLVRHRQVDITTMVEVQTETGSFPLAHPLHDCDTRSVADLTDELREVKSRPQSGGSGRLLMKWGRRAGRVPLLADLFYFFARRSVHLRGRMGTVTLSAVGMMTGGSGFLIGVPTLASTTVLVGAVTEQPWVVDGEIAVRRVVDLVIQIDHKVVDGAPAARFGARLRELLLDPDLLDW